MTEIRTRRSFETGHVRKFLLIVDESQEVESALHYAAARVAHTNGRLVMLYVIEPQEYQHWAGVRQVQIEEETVKAKALFRMFKRKLALAGYEGIQSEEVIREGLKSEQILSVIADDDDIAIMVLGASTDSKGPGPLVSTLAAGKAAGTFPIPITIVPGNLSLDAIKGLA